MTTQQALAELESLGTAQNRKIYQRHGSGPNVFGVSFAHLGKLQKKIKTDHALALDLWRSGNADARNLAMMIGDPAQMTARDLEAWGRDLNRFLNFCFARFAARTPHARAKAEAWMDSDSEDLSCVGWILLNDLATADGTLPDAWFEKLLGTIQREIHQRPNWVRYGMNMAVIGIGLRNPSLQKKAIATARAIGKVEVDMGETSCKVPDVEAYILKTVAHRKAKAAKAKPKAAARKR